MDYLINDIPKRTVETPHGFEPSEIVRDFFDITQAEYIHEEEILTAWFLFQVYADIVLLEDEELVEEIDRVMLHIESRMPITLDSVLERLFGLFRRYTIGYMSEDTPPHSLFYTYMTISRFEQSQDDLLRFNRFCTAMISCACNPESTASIIYQTNHTQTTEA